MTAHSIKAVLSQDFELGSQVEVAGWVRTCRVSKGGFAFIHLSDGSALATLQVVAEASLPNYDNQVARLSAGCAVRVKGVLAASQGRGQDRELKADGIEVLGWVEQPEAYPIAKKRHSFEYLRGVAHLRPRTNTFAAVARVRDGIAQAVQAYFRRHGFLWVHTPIITANDCEGAGALFRVSTLDRLNRPAEEDFFGVPAYLTVSGQLNVESYACALGRVYTFGPTFRAENSNTSRHLAEFWMIEPEVAFADLDDLADLAEDFLKSVTGQVLDEHAEDLQFFNDRIDDGVLDRLSSLRAAKFARLDYGEAIALLQRSGRSFEFPVAWGADLQSEHERFLTEEIVGGPVVVVNYPRAIKAFYMRLNDDRETVAAMDVLAPGVGEIIGGSQREERLDELDARLQALGLGDDLWWYRDLRRYGTVPHAGFGLGLERLVMTMTGMDNIRDVVPFPRTPRNASF
ncbi:MAG: asparagine--tRNA ligase [Gammaproteobacteria bacterium]|nr:asparagine--tRNA ligase [Gammaproteobacteria bacterium]